jgi:hypothetical protein
LSAEAVPICAAPARVAAAIRVIKGLVFMGFSNGVEE